MRENVDGHIDGSIASAQKAVALGPGDAEAYITIGYVQMFAGNFAEAVAAIEIALKLDPNLSPFNRQVAGLVSFFNRQNDLAIATLERARNEGPEIDHVLTSLGAAYARGGRIADAQLAIEQAIRLPSSDPSYAGFWMRWNHFRNQKDFAFLLDALRRTGVPDWPFGFQKQGRERLGGDEIKQVLYGHTLKGVAILGEEEASATFYLDGTMQFKSQVLSLSADTRIDQNFLCVMIRDGFSLPDCGPVLKNTGEYPFISVNSAMVFYFARAD